MHFVSGNCGFFFRCISVSMNETAGILPCSKQIQTELHVEVYRSKHRGSTPGKMFGLSSSGSSIFSNSRSTGKRPESSPVQCSQTLYTLCNMTTRTPKVKLFLKLQDGSTTVQVRVSGARSSCHLASSCTQRSHFVNLQCRNRPRRWLDGSSTVSVSYRWRKCLRTTPEWFQVHLQSMQDTRRWK